MIYWFLDFCRSATRRLGVMRLVSPLVRSVEKGMLGRMGSYEAVAIAPDQTRLTASSGIELVMGPPAEFAHLARLVYERPMLTAVLNGLGPIAKNAVAWDIGANAGFYSSALARLTLPNGRVFCFEPVPATCRLLVESLRVAGAGNATAHAIALSDRDGEADMASRDGENTTRSLEAQGSDAVRVVTARADTLVGNARVPQPNLIKLDVEGHEMKALAGMSQVLAHPDCRALLCEIHFGILHDIGERHVTERLHCLLGKAGFRSTRWVSRSHLLALK